MELTIFRTAAANPEREVRNYLDRTRTCEHCRTAAATHVRRFRPTTTAPLRMSALCRRCAALSHHRTTPRASFGKTAVSRLSPQCKAILERARAAAAAQGASC